MKYLFLVTVFMIGHSAFAVERYKIGGGKPVHHAEQKSVGTFTEENDPYLLACRKMISEASDDVVPAHARTEPKICYCARIGYVVVEDMRLGTSPKNTMKDGMMHAQQYMRKLAKMNQDDREQAMLKSLQEEFRNPAQHYQRMKCEYK